MAFGRVGEGPLPARMPRALSRHHRVLLGVPSRGPDDRHSVHPSSGSLWAIPARSYAAPHLGFRRILPLEIRPYFCHIEEPGLLTPTLGSPAQHSLPSAPELGERITELHRRPVPLWLRHRHHDGVGPIPERSLGLPADGCSPAPLALPPSVHVRRRMAGLGSAARPPWRVRCDAGVFPADRVLIAANLVQRLVRDILLGGPPAERLPRRGILIPDLISCLLGDLRSLAAC